MRSVLPGLVAALWPIAAAAEPVSIARQEYMPVTLSTAGHVDGCGVSFFASGATAGGRSFFLSGSTLRFWPAAQAPYLAIKIAVVEDTRDGPVERKVRHVNLKAGQWDTQRFRQLDAPDSQARLIGVSSQSDTAFFLEFPLQSLSDGVTVTFSLDPQQPDFTFVLTPLGPADISTLRELTECTEKATAAHVSTSPGP